MPSVQFQKDKSDSGGIILHSIVINVITWRNYINIQDSPTLPEKKVLLYLNFSFGSEDTLLTIHSEILK